MKVPVFHSYDKWHLSGVNTWTVNLIRAMRDTEFDSQVLFTGIPRSPQPELEELIIPYDFLDIPYPHKRHQEWRVLKEFLEARAPCIYITNYDFHRSCAVGTFSPEVRVVTVIHSDEECYFDELCRIGQSCNAIICVSSYLTAKVKQCFPHLADRIHFVPHGIPLQLSPLPLRSIDGPLRLCYCNRLQQYQKRIFDLPVIASALEKLGVDYELDIAGDGPDANELRRRFDQAKLKSPIRFLGRVSNTRVMDLCRSAHLFLLTSDFEGLPISLLEAMSVGCVPVVYDIESGISDALPNGDYGFRVSHGDVVAFALIINGLVEKREKLEEISNRVLDRMIKHFSAIKMAKNYQAVFMNFINHDMPFTVIRNQSILLPKDLRLGTRILRRLKEIIKNRRFVLL